MDAPGVSHKRGYKDAIDDLLVAAEEGYHSSFDPYSYRTATGKRGSATDWYVPALGAIGAVPAAVWQSSLGSSTAASERARDAEFRRLAKRPSSFSMSASNRPRRGSVREVDFWKPRFRFRRTRRFRRPYRAFYRRHYRY